jgi:hypothetical protein
MTVEERIRQNRRQLQDVERQVGFRLFQRCGSSLQPRWIGLASSQIFNLETQYFENANPQGNALRGGFHWAVMHESKQQQPFQPLSIDCRL